MVKKPAVPRRLSEPAGRPFTDQRMVEGLELVPSAVRILRMLITPTTPFSAQYRARISIRSHPSHRTPTSGMRLVMTSRATAMAEELTR